MINYFYIDYFIIIKHSWNYQLEDYIQSIVLWILNEMIYNKIRAIGGAHEDLKIKKYWFSRPRDSTNSHEHEKQMLLLL